MASWKTVLYSLIIVLGVMSSFLIETEGSRVQNTRFTNKPPRLRHDIKVRNKWQKKPAVKKNRLRTGIEAGTEVALRLPNPPVVFHEILEHWPYNRIYYTSYLGIINYIRKLLWIAYKFFWLLFDIFIIILKIIFQATEIGKLKHSYDALSKPHSSHHANHHNHDYDYY